MHNAVRDKQAAEHRCGLRELTANRGLVESSGIAFLEQAEYVA